MITATAKTDGTVDLVGVQNTEWDLVIPPGTGWVPTWAAAGTTFLGGYSVTWEEIPV